MKLLKHLFVFLCTWEIISIVISNSNILPSVFSILKIFPSLANDSLFMDSLLDSVFFIFKSWFVILLILFFITLLSLINNGFRYIFKSLCICFQPSPTFTWLPIFILIFGINETTMLITMIFGTIWLVGLNLINVIETSYEKWNKHCKNLNLNIFKSICLVYFPSMEKIILSMFKTSFNLSWRTMIAMEIIFGAVGKHLGMGTYMNDARELLDVNKMYAIFFIITLLGVFINWLIDIVTKNQNRKEISI